MRQKIIVKDLRLYACHGVTEQERVVGSNFTVSVEVVADLTPAATHDDIGHTINYAEIAHLVREEMDTPSRLVENVAWRIARRILGCFSIAEEVRVVLLKENPPMGADCAGAGVDFSLHR